MIPRRVGLTPGNMEPKSAVLPTAPVELPAPPVDLGAEFKIEGQEPAAVQQPAERFVLKPLPATPAIPFAAATRVAAQTGNPTPEIILSQLKVLTTIQPDHIGGQSSTRDFFVKRELAVSVCGYLLLTPKGLTYLADFGLL